MVSENLLNEATHKVFMFCKGDERDVLLKTISRFYEHPHCQGAIPVFEEKEARILYAGYVPLDSPSGILEVKWHDLAREGAFDGSLYAVKKTGRLFLAAWSMGTKLSFFSDVRMLAQEEVEQYVALAVGQVGRRKGKWARAKRR